MNGQQKDGNVRYAPLCLLKFNPEKICRISKSYEVLDQYNSYKELNSISDRLRWCREQKKLKQEEVAAYLGLVRSTYVSYERGDRNSMPKWMIDKLAILFEIPVYALLDDYNRFLYDGQKEAIRKCKKDIGAQTESFQELIRTDPQRIERWENEEKQVSKKSWEKYFSITTDTISRNLG